MAEVVSSTQTETTRRSDLRIAIVSDAILGRNGVGTYYPDLLTHIQPRVSEARLFSPSVKPESDVGEFCNTPSRG